MESSEDSEPVEVPFDELSAAAQEGVIDEMVLREGTDYGAEEVSFEAKRHQIRALIEAGEVRLMFDPALQSCTLQFRDGR